MSKIYNTSKSNEDQSLFQATYNYFRNSFHQNIRFSLLIVIVLFSNIAVFASEPFNNINGFYGERSAGLSGAFTAISDDPSGAYYNPAGLAFAYQDGFSISASNFKTADRKYLNIDTPGQVYTQSHQGFDPNFVGILKSFDSWKFGFSIVNTYNLNYDRTDQVNFPLISPTINQTRNTVKENSSQLLVGPSASYLITDKLAFGFTLYYMQDVRKTSKTQFQQFANNSYVMRSFIDNKQVSGLLPILGLQYQATDKLSLGASLRRILVTGGNRLYNEVYTDSLRGTGPNAVDFIEGTQNIFSSVEAGVISSKPKLIGSIPETTELRLGAAFFPSSKLLASFDIIYTTGFKTFRDQNEFQVSGSRINYIVNDREIRELTRVKTINFAFGTEYYLADTFAVSCGFFTNDSNTKPISWTDSAIDLGLQAYNSNQLRATQGNASLTYQIPRSGTNPRNEYSNNRGISLGMSWVTAKSSISLTYIREFGKGNSRIDPNSLSQSFEYSAQTLYVMVSSRN
ncbi:OmpP1/FadL family transporter [Leptospira sp. GIMC2001]|uniref:OmpP1/FadL family transporter n=1 Tax=Leptospira sp. GIMC2001 TaxID=1513297 RepID=UPI00234A62C9|nr:transporter, Ompp1/FadL/TodX family protein [Leptospira sp. GIMC2001]WCL48128.1 transporter, Ompp1/FadL/TodX family protein [Leptospira sp. GIMC2001]